MLDTARAEISLMWEHLTPAERCEVLLSIIEVRCNLSLNPINILSRNTVEHFIDLPAGQIDEDTSQFVQLNGRRLL